MTLNASRQRLLGPDSLKPLNEGFEVIGAFNPGAVRVDKETVLLVRVAEKPLAVRSGFVGLPRVVSGGSVSVDWTPEVELDLRDKRVVRRKADGIARLTSLSHLRVFRRREGGSGWTPGPALLPETSAEEYGIEDPRITTIDGLHWITYVAVSRHGAATALASTTDFVAFERHGVIFPPENKDVVLFPRMIAGMHVALHRPTTRTDFCRPEIWLARSPDLLHWGQHQPLLCGLNPWESERVGAGPPPIQVDEGWLVIYHGCGPSQGSEEVGAYCAGAVLLDLNDPTRIVRRSVQPIMRPAVEFDRNGFVPNVVFPTGLIDHGARLSVYYGAADTAVGLADLSRDELLSSLN